MSKPVCRRTALQQMAAAGSTVFWPGVIREFTWHPTNFPDPKAILDQLHAQHFRVIVHVVIKGRRLLGTVKDPCTAEPLPPGRTPDDRWPPERQVSC